MFARHVTKHLSAYYQGEVSDQEAKRIAKHLEQCPRCKAQCDEIKRGIILAEHLSRVSPPTLVWSELETALQLGESAPRLAERTTPREKRLPHSMLVPASVIFIGLVAATVGYFALHTQTAQTQVNLDKFLGAIETHPKDMYGLLSDAPAGFEDADRWTALAAAGIEKQPAESPLEGYQLAHHRLKVVDRQQAVQLVYVKETRVFSVFVAPRSSQFSFGKRDIKDAQFDGVACRQVDCPRTSTLWFGAGEFNCVLVTKSKDPGELVAIVHYFVSAHQKRSQQ